MNFNYQKARNLMVENQLRPNKIKDPIILNIFKKIPKESFMLEEVKVIPYSDSDIPIAANRGYLKNLHIAQLINNAEINKNHKVLHLGALTGYVTTILSHLSLEVIAIETEDELIKKLKKNINSLNLQNIKIFKENFKDGCKSEAPFNRIFIDTPIKKLDYTILDQLSEDSGKIIMIQKESNNFNKAIKITKNMDNFSNEYLFDVFSNYELFKDKEGFYF